MRIIKNLKSCGFFVGQELTVVDKEFIQEQGPGFLNKMPFFARTCMIVVVKEQLSQESFTLMKKNNYAK